MLKTFESWQGIRQCAGKARGLRISRLCEHGGPRSGDYVAEACGIRLDYSRTALTDESLNLLLKLLDEADLRGATGTLFAGQTVNTTENRAAGHTALRSAIAAAEGPFSAEVRAEYTRLVAAARDLAVGSIDHLVNIGIGGSDLGPRHVDAAFADLPAAGPTAHFVSSLDRRDLDDCLAGLDPARTAIVISSKSFTTEETLVNAEAAIAWLRAGLGDRSAGHLYAVTGDAERAAALGVPAEHVFHLWPWVGGRYSVWSAIGLPVLCHYGAEAFESLLAGAWEMDRHFRDAPWRENLPALLAVIEVWHRNALGYGSLAVVPYSYRLRLLPAWLQQLVMESDGKSVDSAGQRLTGDSAPVVWGTAGTEGQHSYFQLLHQGTDVIPVDFILPLATPGDDPERTLALAAHCIAQGATLMHGKSLEESFEELVAGGMPDDEARRLAPHRTLPGNRPSNTLLLNGLTPHTLGALMALYEHKTFACGVLWGINTFDQWGVETGKQVSRRIRRSITEGKADSFDSTTRRLIETVKRWGG